MVAARPRLISEKEVVLLRLLASGQALHGLALVDASEGGIARGTVYVTLYRMADRGLVATTSVRAPGVFRPGAAYTITPEGARVLDAYERFVASF